MKTALLVARDARACDSVKTAHTIACAARMWSWAQQNKLRQELWTSLVLLLLMCTVLSVNAQRGVGHELAVGEQPWLWAGLYKSCHLCLLELPRAVGNARGVCIARHFERLTCHWAA